MAVGAGSGTKLVAAKPPRDFLPIDTVEQILFSFYNGELYKISVTYDEAPRKGSLRRNGEVHFAKYGPRHMLRLR